MDRLVLLRQYRVTGYGDGLECRDLRCQGSTWLPFFVCVWGGMDKSLLCFDIVCCVCWKAGIDIAVDVHGLTVARMAERGNDGLLTNGSVVCVDRSGHRHGCSVMMFALKGSDHLGPEVGEARSMVWQGNG